MKMIQSIKILATLWWIANDPTVMKPTVAQITLVVVTLGVALLTLGGWTILIQICGSAVLVFIALLGLRLFMSSVRNFRTRRKFEEDKDLDCYVIKNEY
jgi:hypothetical protein